MGRKREISPDKTPREAPDQVGTGWGRRDKSGQAGLAHLVVRLTFNSFVLHRIQM